MRSTLFGLVVAAAMSALVGLPPAKAHATTLVFGQISSDSTPASSLQATLGFHVVGSTLLVQATNQTTSAAPYDIYWIYFNASSDVTGLSLSGYNDPYWTLYNQGYQVTTPTFGGFDYSLWSYGPSQPQSYIQPGESMNFTLSIACRAGAVCDSSDFAGELTNGRTPVLASMRFVRMGIDTAFGGSTTVIPAPEPGTFALVALGLAGIAGAGRPRSRRQS